VGAGRAAVARTGLAEHRGLDRDLVLDPEGHLVQAQLQPKQGVRALADPATRPAPVPAAEERLEDVAEAAEAVERAAGAAAPAVGRERIAAQIDDAALLGIAQHLVGGGDLLEAVLRGLIRVHIGVQLASELAVGPLQLLGRRVPSDSEHRVVIAHRACHLRTSLNRVGQPLISYWQTQRPGWHSDVSSANDQCTAGTVRANCRQANRRPQLIVGKQIAGPG
jgi:hypothetical protein